MSIVSANNPQIFEANETDAEESRPDPSRSRAAHPAGGLKAELAKSFWDAVRRVRDARRTAAPSLAPTGASPLVARDGTDVSMQEALHRLDAIRAQCRALVTRRAALSAGAAVVPLPGLDVGADVAILIKLLPKINQRFGLTHEQIDRLDSDTKSVVMMFITGLGSSLVGRLITRELVIKVLMKLGVRVTTKGIVKFVPLMGQALSASISFGAMKLLGNQHIDDCYEVARRTLVERAGSVREGNPSPPIPSP